jgi:tRNA(adenine34) deaminase
MTMTEDERWMDKALAEARSAGERRDIPIGAAVVRDGELIASAGNQRTSTTDPSAHAEILALRRASERLNRSRLDDCTLYVTIEPCPMCAGAIVEARISRLVFGAREPRSGAARSMYQILDDPRRNHQVDVSEGVRADASKSLLQSFFQSRRR